MPKPEPLTQRRERRVRGPDEVAVRRELPVVLRPQGQGRRAPTRRAHAVLGRLGDEPARSGRSSRLG